MPSEAGFGADGGRDVGGAQYKKVPMRSDQIALMLLLNPPLRFVQLFWLLFLVRVVNVASIGAMVDVVGIMTTDARAGIALLFRCR